jgi:hypothetical protein
MRLMLMSLANLLSMNNFFYCQLFSVSNYRTKCLLGFIQVLLRFRGEIYWIIFFWWFLEIICFYFIFILHFWKILKNRYFENIQKTIQNQNIKLLKPHKFPPHQLKLIFTPQSIELSRHETKIPSIPLESLLKL